MLCKHAAEKKCVNCKWWGTAWGRSKVRKTCEDWGWGPESVCSLYEMQPNDPPGIVVRVPELGEEKEGYSDLTDSYSGSAAWMKEQGFINKGGVWYNFYWDKDSAWDHAARLNKQWWVRKTVGNVTPAEIENIKHIWNRLPYIAQDWLDRRMLLRKGKQACLSLIKVGKYASAAKVAKQFDLSTNWLEAELPELTDQAALLKQAFTRLTTIVGKATGRHVS